MCFISNVNGLKCNFLGRVAFAVKCCGYSFGKKDADRPVVFWNHVHIISSNHIIRFSGLFFFLKKNEKIFCTSLGNTVWVL